MCRLGRLEGLELLRVIGAPVPKWQTVRESRDIGRLRFSQTDCGWTIRTCRNDCRREMGLFYRNYIDPDTAVRVLRERTSKVGLHEFYIVYPSWRFRFSCNVVLRDEIYTIEGKYGSQKSLASGKRGPEFGFEVPYGLRSQMRCYISSPNEEVITWLGRILLWCKHIPRVDFYTEVALTHRSELMFYELF